MLKTADEHASRDRATVAQPPALFVRSGPSEAAGFVPALTEPSRLALHIRRLSLAGSPRTMGAIPQKHHLWQRTFRTFGPRAFAAEVGQAVDRRSAMGQTPKLCRGSHLICQMIGSVYMGLLGRRQI